MRISSPGLTLIRTGPASAMSGLELRRGRSSRRPGPDARGRADGRADRKGGKDERADRGGGDLGEAIKLNISVSLNPVFAPPTIRR